MADADWKWIGPALLSAMQQKNLSVRDAAKLIGCSPATINRIANGRAPDIDNYFRVARWLQTPPTRKYVK